MSARRDPRNGRWRYRRWIQLPDGRRVKISGTPALNTKKAAEEAERAHILRMLNPTLEPEKKEAPRFRDYAEEFLETYALTNNKVSEYETKRSAFRNHLVPFFGTKRLDEIRELTIERFKAHQLKAGLSPKSVNNHLTMLRRSLVIAKKWEYVDRVPEFEWLKTAAPEFDFLDFGEARRLLEAADEEWRPMIGLAMKTGLRKGELVALRWEDVDLVAGRVVVRRAESRGVISTPKSGRNREVPLSAEALRLLKGHRHLRGELVFCQDTGQMLRRGQLKRPLWRACKRAGLRLIGWHMLRHTFASHLVMRGVPLKAVQELLGHATMEMTMRYSHLSPDVRRDAVAKLDLLDEAEGGKAGRRNQTG